MTSEVGSMASVWAHAESTGPSTTQTSKPTPTGPANRTSQPRGLLGGRRRGRGGTPAKKLTTSAETSLAVSNEPPTTTSTRPKPQARHSETPVTLASIASLPPKPPLTTTASFSAPKPRRSNTSASSKNAEAVPKEPKVLSEAAQARKLTRKRGKANSTKKRASLDTSTNDLASSLEVPPVVSSEPLELGASSSVDSPKSIAAPLDGTSGPVAEPDSHSEETELSTSTASLTPHSITSHSTAAEPITLAPTSVALPRAITPVSQLDWADEDDDDLPDLDDWGITKPGTVTVVPNVLLSQEAPKLEAAEIELASADTSYNSESSSTPKVEGSGTEPRTAKNALEKRFPTSRPIALPASVLVPTTPPRLAPLDITLSVPDEGTHSLASGSTSASPTTATSPAVIADSKARGRTRPPLDPEVLAAKKKAKNDKFKEKRAAQKLARKAEKAASQGSGGPTTTSPVTAAESSQAEDVPVLDKSTKAEGKSLLSRIGALALNDESVVVQPESAAVSSQPPVESAEARLSGLPAAPQTAGPFTASNPPTGPRGSRQSRPPPPSAPANSSSFDSAGASGPGRRYPNPKQPFTFPAQRQPPASAGPGSSPPGDRWSGPRPASPFGAGSRPPRGGGRGMAHRHHESTSRPVIASSALSQLSKSLSGGSRTHNSAAVSADS